MAHHPYMLLSVRAHESEGTLLCAAVWWGWGTTVNSVDSGNVQAGEGGSQPRESNHSLEESNGRVKWGIRPHPATQEVMLELGSEVRGS